MINSPAIWSFCNMELDVSRRTVIMGILNVTPDSFSDGGSFFHSEEAVAQALQMQQDGADIIDIGGESTRPGSAPVTLDEELDRVIPIIEKLAPELQIPISIDTYKAGVARQALQAGAKIVNDISGLRFDPQMASTIANFNAGVVIMHIKGAPRDMQKNPYYNDVIAEISEYLTASADLAIHEGIKKAQIVIDPGIGFGKRLEDNLEIIRNLAKFKILGYPLLVGPSRKSFIGAILDLPVEQRLEGTIAASAACILNGANILRVHDVLEIKRAATLIDKLNKDI
ncbi:MAG TPA: dihydropteroate synthase [bacterium]|nr:dihydropteroate synthase [bacterium]HPN45439.1 dihydropteroate synthase [bacterium]